MKTEKPVPELPLGQLEEVLEIHEQPFQHAAEETPCWCGEEEYDGRECEHGRGLTEFCRPCFDRQKKDDRYLR